MLLSLPAAWAVSSARGGAMSLVDRLPFGAALAHELTRMDRADSSRRGWNPYALGQYLQAAERVAQDIAAGATRERAFADAFCPTRGIHGVARRLGLALDVERGEWIVRAR